MIGSAAAGFAVQLRHLRGTPDWFLALFTAPLLTAVFVSIFQYAGRSDLTAYGVLAPALIALFQMSLQTAGELISRERENGSLEGLLAVPASFAAVLFGRIAAVCAVSLFAFVESWAVGWLMTGSPTTVEHPFAFGLTLLLTAVAMTGWAGVMACVFVLTRSARTFQNSLSYPFYLLGGVIVPVDVLPDWVAWPARLVFLSWSSDLMRDSLATGTVDQLLPRLAAVVLLGAAGYLLSGFLLRRTLNRVRSTGSLTFA